VSASIVASAAASTAYSASSIAAAANLMASRASTSAHWASGRSENGLRARWDEEIDLVAATIELDERTILIAVGRGLELRHPRANLLVDRRRLTAKSHAEIRPAGDRAGLEPPFDGVVVRPKRDAGAIFGAAASTTPKNLRPRTLTTSSSSCHARAIAAGSSRARKNATGVGSRSIRDGRIAQRDYNSLSRHLYGDLL
jgi:hypothetical protein